MNPNPRFLVPSEGLTATQRKSLGLQKVPPRPRLPGEAGPRIYVNASQRESYTGAELKEAPARAGSMDAYQIKTRGIEST